MIICQWQIQGREGITCTDFLLVYIPPPPVLLALLSLLL